MIRINQFRPEGVNPDPFEAQVNEALAQIPEISDEDADSVRETVFKMFWSCVTKGNHPPNAKGIVNHLYSDIRRRRQK